MFTDDVKREIASKFKTGHFTKTDLSKMYGCSPRTIGRVIDEVGDDTQHTKPNAMKFYGSADDRMITILQHNLETGEIRTECAYYGTEKYDQALDHFHNGRYEDAYRVLSFKQRIEDLCMGKVTAKPESGVLIYQDGPNEFTFPDDLADRIINAIKSGETNQVRSLMKFANRLSQNPSKRSVEELYSFLEAADIEIDSDGMILCYKKVRADYTDVHSGQFDNRVGQTPTMPRSMVDDDSNRTCSSGLHVCSKAYLPHFGGDRVMLCAVDPADVVSVPNDYYSNDNGNVKAKMRVCRYEVVSEVTDQI